MTRPLTRLETAFALLFIPVAAISWLAMVLAETGAFSATRTLVGAGVLAVAAWAWLARDLRGTRAPEANGSRCAPAVLAIVLAAAAALYAKPGEYLIEGRDASVYLAIGHSIHRSGGLAEPDPVMPLLAGETREALLARDRSWPFLLNRFPGGVQVAAGDRIAPGFFHLLPVWIAVFVGVLGAHGGYYVNVVFGVLAVLATYLVGRRAWSAGAGIAAAILLAVNFGQIWHARIASSEMLAQWFLLAGILFAFVAYDTQARFAGALAGAAVGLAELTRVDALIVLLPLGVAWVVLAWRRRLLGRALPWFAATFVLISAHAIAHAAVFAAPYTLRLAATAWVNAARVTDALGVGIALVLTAASLAGLWVLMRLLPSAARLPTLAGLSILAAVIASPGVVRTTGLLMTPVGAAAAVAGFFWTTRRNSDRFLLLVAPFAAEAILWLVWRETTTLPADFRRVVPAVLPLGFLFAGALAARAASAGAWGRRGAWLAIAGLATASLWQAWPTLRTPPMQGVHAEVEQLAGRIPASSIVIFDRSALSHLPLAMQATFGRAALQLTGRVPPGGALHAFIDRTIAAGRRVFVALADYPGDPPRRLWRSDLDGLHVASAGVSPMPYTDLEPSAVRFPRRLVTHTTGFELYEIRRAADAPAAVLPFTADFGSEDFAYVLGGFHASEAMPSARARWTAAEAQIWMPRLQIPGSRPVRLVLRLAAWRPPGMSAPSVRLSIDGIAVGTIAKPGPGFEVFEIPLGPVIADRLRSGPSVLVFSSDSFVPRAAGIGPDDRVLGVALDWLRIE